MRNPLLILFFLIPAASFLSGQPAAEPAYYVSPDGDDRWSGRLAEPNGEGSDGPFATIERAREVVRGVKDDYAERGEALVVTVRGGTYFLEKPIRFEPEDSGTEGAPIIYRAHGNERPVFSGGERITGWDVGDDGRWRVTVPGVREGQRAFSQLFVDDQRRYRPRLPETGYYRIAEQIDPTPESEGRGHDRFGYADGDIRSDWANLDDVEILGFHTWSASRMRIREIDTRERVITFTSPTRATQYWGAFPEGNRYLAVNVREALDSPGEWYLDRPSGELTYIPREGESPDDTVVIAPRLDRLVVFAGDISERRWVEHVELHGLTFAHANWTLPPEGQSFPQAEVQVDGAVTAEGARHIVFKGCAVRHVGGYAMAFGAGSRNNLVERCELVDLGAGGVKIGTGGGRGSWAVGSVDLDDPEASVLRNAVRDSTLAHGGRLHPAGVGVWIGHASHTRIEHNAIFDFYYTGVSVGWSWGYHPSRSRNNAVEFNHIHTLGQEVLSDMGGVYTLGVSPGTTVSNNRIHDVQSYDYGGWGLYTDEGSTELVMENNLVYRTKTGGFHQHYGRENRIVNNIFAFAEEHQLQRTRTEDHTSFLFERNIVYWDNESPLLGRNWRDDNFVLDRNLYWHPDGTGMRVFEDLDFEEWRAERDHDENSIVADPLFVAPREGDFRLSDDSPAFEIGFEPFDTSRAGRVTAPELTKDLPPPPPGFRE